jgi:signal transduction histidine kinase
MVNLMANARDAMRATPPPRRLTLTTRFDATRQCVALEVADTGPGIPPDIQARLFEPFFTTKPPGQGTGLGLSLVQDIIRSHEGVIRVESPPGQGAHFVIELPAQAPPATEKADTRASDPLPGLRGQTILIVDDEPDHGTLT